MKHFNAFCDAQLQTLESDIAITNQIMENKIRKSFRDVYTSLYHWQIESLESELIKFLTDNVISTSNSCQDYVIKRALVLKGYILINENQKTRQNYLHMLLRELRGCDSPSLVVKYSDILEEFIKVIKNGEK